MKKILIILFAFISVNSFGQVWKTVKGNGDIKKESREISNFTSLISQGSMNVEISYGNSNSLTIEGDENLLPYIETNVENGRLYIKSKKNINLKSKSPIIVHVSMTKIGSLQVSGSGNIYGNGSFSNDAKTDISVSGSGNLKLNFDTFKDLDLSVSGSGNIELKGNTTNNITAHVSGSGNIDCSNIKTNDADIKISGSGNVKVYAQNSIDAKINGSGNVFYKGDAQKINSKVSGSGKIIKM